MRNFNPSLEDLREQGLIFYEVVAGSVAYGLNTPQSDEDLRGYFHVPLKYKNGLGKSADQANDAKNDITFYNMKRAFNLLMTANPNQIELLWIPEDCIRTYHKPIMDEMLANRELFISKASYVSHFQYAKAQIGKAKGRNKWVNNPQPENPPKKLDFCWFINPFDDCIQSTWHHMEMIDENVPAEYNEYPWKDLVDSGMSQKDAIGKYQESFRDSRPPDYLGSSAYPMRPIPVKNVGHLHRLEDHCVAKLEHLEHTYRLYGFGKGVFRGPNQQLVCDSISPTEEFDYFKGLLIFNEPAYKQAYKNWKNYWDWIKNRNDARWIDQENGKLDYDAKNMSHCMRLMLSSKHILTEGYPIVRFEGDTRDLLMNIKKGELEYAEIMEMVNSLQEELEGLVEKTHIPDEVDFEKLNKLYIHLDQIAEKELV